MYCTRKQIERECVYVLTVGIFQWKKMKEMKENERNERK